MAAPSSTLLQPLAEAIEGRLRTIGDLKTYVWTPRDLDQLPAAVIELPDVRRPDPDEVDLVGVGANGWIVEYPVTFFFDLQEANYAQSQAVSYVEAAVLAIDYDRSLQPFAPVAGGGVIDSAMTLAEAVIVEDRKRVLISYECTVTVLLAIPDADP